MELDFTLVNIDELPSGEAQLNSKFMFGINEVLHTDTIQRIVDLANASATAPLNALKIVNIFPHPTFDNDFKEDQLNGVAQAINYSLSEFYGGTITAQAGEQIVFRIIQSTYSSPEPFILIPNILWRYFSLVSGELSFTGITSAADELRPDGIVRTEPDDVVDLGDIDDAEVYVAFNASINAPFTMTENTFIKAIQDGELRLWKWNNVAGLYGGVETQAQEEDFILLTPSNVGTNATALRFVPFIGVDTSQYELQWVAQAINNRVIATGQPFVCNEGEQMVFFINILLGEPTEETIPVLERRYYRLTTGATSVSSITNPNQQLMPDGAFKQDINDFTIDLGDIDDADVWDAFNDDPEEPFTISGDTFIKAETDTGFKLWYWVGGNGTFGASATPAVESDFLELSDQPVVPDEFDPSNYDLDEFQNESADPYARLSELPIAGDFISQVITDGVTNKAPSEDAVFDRLLLGLNTKSSRRVHAVLPRVGEVAWASQNGALKIKLPVHSNYTSSISISLEIRINNDPFEIHKIDLTARPSSSTSWVNTSRNQNKILSSNNRTFDVRYGNDGTSPCIWIGTTGSAFSTSSVYFFLRYVSYAETTDTGLNLDFIRTGWTLSRVESYDTVVATQTTTPWSADAETPTLQDVYDESAPLDEIDPTHLFGRNSSEETGEVGVIGLVKFSQNKLNTVTVDGTTSEVSLLDPNFGTVDLDPEDMFIGAIYRFTARGEYTANNEDFDIRFKLGAEEVVVNMAVNGNASDLPFRIDAELKFIAGDDDARECYFSGVIVRQRTNGDTRDVAIPITTLTVDAEIAKTFDLTVEPSDNANEISVYDASLNIVV